MVNSPFRRSVRSETRRTGGRGRGGGFYDRYRLPQGYPTALMLINAEYTDPSPSEDEIEIDPQTGRPLDVKQAFFKFRKHRVKFNQNDFRDEVCSAGWNPHAPQPCVGCFAQDSGDRRVTVADNFAFGIVHLAVYHRHPLLDKRTGGIVMKRDSNPQVPVMIDSECLVGRNCNFCRVQQGHPPVNDPQNPWPGFRPQDITTIFGKRRYLEMGKNHLGDLGSWDATVSSYCGHDGSQLITDSYTCPTCRNRIIDMASDQRTDQQIADAVSKPYPCITCNRPVLLNEVTACEVCESQRREPLQLSIFNRVLFGKREGEGTASHLLLDRHMSLDEFARNIDPRWFGGKTIQQVVEELAKPFDFEKIFQPRDLRAQSERLQLPMPGRPPPQQGGMYGQTGVYPYTPPPPGGFAPAPQGQPYPGQPYPGQQYQGAPPQGQPIPMPAPYPGAAPGPYPAPSGGVYPPAPAPGYQQQPPPYQPYPPTPGAPQPPPVYSGGGNHPQPAQGPAPMAPYPPVPGRQ